MVMSVLRLNFVLPGLDPQRLSDMYRAGIEMAEYADQHGFTAVSLEEHHGADDGWSPAPLLTAGMVLARTSNVLVTISALLVPLHDPLRLAEDIAVLDLTSKGRLAVIAGLGYRPEEYAAHGKDWAARGKLMDECLEAMLNAWTGEPFEYRGQTVKVTPTPLTKPHPLVFVGGTAKPAARRAARLGLPFFPAAHLPELAEYYTAQCAEHGTQGFAIMPPGDTAMTFVAEDPDAAWAELGEHFLHEATTYAGWQTPDIKSSMHSHATTVDALRAEGIYRILSPQQCIDQAREQGEMTSFALHPMCGGLPVDRAWESLHLYAEKVLPEL